MALSIRYYKKGECITFKNTKGEHGSLSNMAPNFPIKIAHIHIRTSEALYQALRFPDYPEIQKHIINYTSPMTAKKYARLHISKTRSDWDKQRFKIMKLCLELKLIYNFEMFSNVLVYTKDLPIVEYTQEDKVWGATYQKGYYVGTNALGRLLMELRKKISDKSFKLLIPDIDNLKLLGLDLKNNLMHLTQKSIPEITVENTITPSLFK
jgi:ribA/ribD-fused uncharacterized protein